MCHPSCIRFGESHLSFEDVAGKAVLEVGSLDVNGSLRTYVCGMNPSVYIGVDIHQGPGVDDLCDITHLVDCYGRERFDLVVCTEVLEHVRDWREAISNLKNVLKPEGKMFLTARSKNFPYHGFPEDFWRFETDDMKFIFSDMVIEVNEKDPDIPGVFVKARRPAAFVEKTFDDFELYAVIHGGRCRDIDELSYLIFKMKYRMRRMLSRILPRRIKKLIREIAFRNQE